GRASCVWDVLAAAAATRHTNRQLHRTLRVLEVTEQTRFRELQPYLDWAFFRPQLLAFYLVPYAEAHGWPILAAELGRSVTVAARLALCHCPPRLQRAYYLGQIARTLGIPRDNLVRTLTRAEREHAQAVRSLGLR
ncbi:MAG TPA: hypothetical protein VEQ12_04070, partial [Candidatus Limnocylindria bacterium]|nr:hypothetical protein [Candidatus Limnocylindria bacterium]